MTRQQEFRKQTEEAKFEAFSLMCRKVADLEKENAELKDKYDTCLRENANLKIHVVYVEKKLTKAKEIIKKLMKHLSRYVWIGDNKTKPVMEKDITEAEQFLNEVEK